MRVAFQLRKYALKKLKICLLPDSSVFTLWGFGISREWREICEHALNVKKNTLCVSKRCSVDGENKPDPPVGLGEGKVQVLLRHRGWGRLCLCALRGAVSAEVKKGLGEDFCVSLTESMAVSLQGVVVAGVQLIWAENESLFKEQEW